MGIRRRALAAVDLYLVIAIVRCMIHILVLLLRLACACARACSSAVWRRLERILPSYLAKPRHASGSWSFLLRTPPPRLCATASPGVRRDRIPIPLLNGLYFQQRRPVPPRSGYLQGALETRSSPSRWVFGSLPSCSPYIRSPTPVPSTCSPATTFNIEAHKSTMDIARQARLQSRRQLRQAKIDVSRNSTANHHAPPVLSISLCQHLSSVVVIHTQAHKEHHATGSVEIPQTSRRDQENAPPAATPPAPITTLLSQYEPLTLLC
jgi:hypothetical protein